MIKILTTLTCPYGLKVIYFGKSLGVEFDVEIISPQEIAGYIKNDERAGSVPLLLDDGFLLNNSDLMVSYLAAKHLQGTQGNEAEYFNEDLYRAMQFSSQYEHLNRALMGLAKASFKSEIDFNVIDERLKMLKKFGAFDSRGSAQLFHRASLVSFIVRFSPYTSVFSSLFSELGLEAWTQSILGEKELSGDLYKNYSTAFSGFIAGQTGIQPENLGEEYDCV